MGRQQRTKQWCFTLNNYTEEEQKQIDFAVDREDVVYMCYGEERGTEGTPHLQGYFELSRKLVLSSVRKLAGLERAHFEPRRGSQNQAIEYCRKDGRFVEFGNRQRPGRRSDLDDVRKRIDAGASLKEIAESNFSVFLQYRKGLQHYMGFQILPRSWITENTVLWGNTGTGKTRWVHDQVTTGTLYIYAGSNPDSPWFDGYEGNESVLFDDFRGYSTLKFEFLLRLLDRYAMQVPVKGGFVEWCPRKIYITSNVPPLEWYPSIGDITPLLRRLHKVKHVDVALYDDIVEFDIEEYNKKVSF